MHTKRLFIGVILIIAIAIGLLVIQSNIAVAPELIVTKVTSFEECKSAGYPILESYPEQCRTPSGELFVRKIEDPTPTTTPAYKRFDSELTMRINERALFEDGFMVDVKEINDSRCKPGVQCIWAGEITTLLVVTGGIQGDTQREVRLGTTNNKSASMKGYTITLMNATIADVTIVVSQNDQATDVAPTPGYVSGDVTIGPICPVEREGHPCVIPPETYTSRNVVVYEADQITIKTKRALNADGSYSVALSPGTYWVQVQPAGIGEGEKKQVSIASGNTSTLDFDIDTGIR